MKTWKIEITLKVDETWVEDGFDASERLEEIQDKLADLLPYAYGHEFQIIAKIKSAPDKKAIRELQGYSN